jgi:acyl dehydratase
VIVSEMNPGDSIPELAVTPDRYLPNRYAGASGDFNPIHIDPEFARQVGLPGAILHGLYVMGLVSKAVTDAAGGDPRSLKGLSVQFRGMSFPEQEIVVTGEVASVEDGVTEIDVIATQGESQVIRNASARVSRDL